MIDKTKIKSITYHLSSIIYSEIVFLKIITVMREFILENSKINIILNTGDVFDKVVRPTAIIISEKKSEEKNSKNLIKIADFSNLKKDVKADVIPKFSEYEEILQSDVWDIEGALFITSFPHKYKLLKKLSENNTKPLIDFVDNDGIQRGVSPDLKKAFLVNQQTINDFGLEIEKMRRVLTGGKHVR